MNRYSENGFWANCPLIEQVEGRTSDEAVAETLETYPSTPGGAAAIRAVVEYRAAHKAFL